LAKLDDDALFAGYVIGVGDLIAYTRTLTKFAKEKHPEIDMLDFYGDICTDGIANGNIKRAVHLWMRLNPDKLDASAASVTTSALAHHFPCP